MCAILARSFLQSPGGLTMSADSFAKPVEHGGDSASSPKQDRSRSCMNRWVKNTLRPDHGWNFFQCAQDPAQFLFRYWIMSANCCRWGATNAIVLLTFQTKPLQSLLAHALGNLSNFWLTFYGLNMFGISVETQWRA